MRKKFQTFSTELTCSKKKISTENNDVMKRVRQCMCVCVDLYSDEKNAIYVILSCMRATKQSRIKQPKPQ